MQSSNLSHSHGHGHGHSELSGRNLLIATVLNVVITIAEIIGGLVSNSLALLSDAIHNLGDTIAVFLAYIANIISKRSANTRKTFGYKRIEILAALFNAVALIVITIFLFKEAWQRFQNPEPIKGLIMFVVATIGLVANLLAVLLLKNDSDKNINIRAAYLHLLGDAISSVAVIVGSVLIYFYEFYWVDPLITVLIGLYILKETWTVLREAVDILMQATPRSIDIEKIRIELEQFDEIDNIHHVHVWNLNDSQIHFECHADLSTDLSISDTSPILTKISSTLRNNFGVNHVTIQFEYDCCDKKSLISKK
ncbi:MAG: cation transporter [Bacteroidales bacterium]|nr:cation transporter [Bacteroidales bacterium]MBN2819534.1 cation transporter [Bacteroidales bacterium]